MAVVVASGGTGRERGELGCCQGRPGSSKPGAQERFGAGARRVGSQVAGAGVGAVQEGAEVGDEGRAIS